MNFQFEYKQVETQDNSYTQYQLADVAASCPINTRPNRSVAFVDRECVTPMTFSQKLYQSHKQEIAEEFEQAIESNSEPGASQVYKDIWRKFGELKLHFVS